MTDINIDDINTPDYWQNRYEQDDIGWDMGAVSPPLKAYFDNQQSNLNKAGKDVNILIAGAGNAYEAEYLHNLGFSSVYVVDFAQAPLDNFSKKIPNFPKKHLIKADFFALDNELIYVDEIESFTGFFDFAIEQTFFCAITPDLRKKYVTQMHRLLKPKAKIIGLLWSSYLSHEIKYSPELKPPFGGDSSEYRRLFGELFEVNLHPCQNSHPARQGRELFIEMIAK